ncbi:MAG: 50S ribosomal protein L21 [Alistipes sp.]|nr:50S ribosomal protein L21 [Alistipes sp.]
MYVIVEIAGQQFKAEKGRKLYVHRLSGEENSSMSFDKVLLVDNGGQVKVGAPVVKGASVQRKILKHLKGDKVLVFKKKRRTGYQKCNGHRQYLTQILVEEIVA